MKNQFFLYPLTIFLLFSRFSFSQTAITAASTSYITATSGTTYSATGAPSSPFSGNTYTYTYGNLSGTSNNDKQVSNFTAGGIVYTFLPIASQYVKMRRVNNAVVTGIRNLKFDEGTITGTTAVTINGTYDDDMESFFVGNKNFNSGTDNLFGNQGDGNGNNNNIERVDVIYPNGIVASDNSKVGFAIFERGATAAHDPVKVAVILSIDGSGNPTSYSSIISITSATYVGTDVVAATGYVISRRDNATESQLKASTTTNQAIGGVLFKYSDFGIANNTTVYGYSVIPNDFAGATPAQLVDYTNATNYPTNSSATTGAGGIDLVSFTGIAQSSPVVKMPISGKVFSDANGLAGTPVNTIDGTGTNVGGTLYAQLVNSGNVVVATVAVNNDGTYSFPAQAPGTYSIVLNTSSTSSSVASLPAGWTNTGENLGTGAGNDGTVNGILTSVVVANAEVTDADFGIEQMPVADPKTDPGQINPGGTTRVSVPVLTGSDPEDGTYTGVSGTNTIIIQTLPVNGILYYNNVAVSAGQTISNFNPSLLTLDPNDGLITVTFTYKEVDVAGRSGAAALVSIPFTSLLPVTLADFSAKINGKKIDILWAVSSEINTAYYEVERSNDGLSFATISKTSTQGISGNKISYQTSDIMPAKGFNYYRLKMVDINGNYTFSKVAIVKMDEIRTTVVSVKPNPFVNSVDVYVDLANTSNIKIAIIDNTGKTVYKNIFKGNNGINRISITDLYNLSKGSYFVNVVTDESSVQKKIVKE